MQEEQHQKKVQRIILELNRNGLSCMAKDQESAAFQYFKQAEKMVTAESKVEPDNSKFQQLLAVSYNNLAIYYKKTGKPKSALTYLKKALQIEAIALKDDEASAATHLNISAIYSFMKKHEQAIEHISLAADLIEKIKKNSSEGENQKQETDKNYQNIRLIASYNLAVQFEHLKMYEQSLEAYENTIELSKFTRRKDLLEQSEESVDRLREIIKSNRVKMVEWIKKKKERDEKGNYESMRKNKKNFRTAGQASAMQMKLRKYELYIEKKQTSSTEKLKKLHPITPHYKHSLADRYKVLSVKEGEKGHQQQI